MIIQLALLIVGLVLLVWGADWLVKGAASIARRLRIPAYVIGLTLVACGTSLPEFTVSILSAWRGYTDVAFGNIVGSNIFNILAILGVGALIAPLATKKVMVERDLTVSLLVTLVLGMLVVADRWSATSEQMVSVIDGIILVGGMCWYIRHLIRTSGGSDDTYEHAQASILATSFYTIIGIGLLVVGSKFLVDSSIYIATYFGLSERVIGLTIIAVGTSLPELATTIIAGIRKQHEIAFGNIVGSNIFNILWILGFTALVKQIPVSVAATHDLGVVLIATLALFALIHTGRKYVLERWQGGLMVGLYITYIGYILSAGQ